ncbi:MAG: alkaline phosphatase D family protein [Janthinobacterium lividum]
MSRTPAIPASTAAAERRQFLALCARAVSLTALSALASSSSVAALPPSASAALAASYPFKLGVASGSPLPNAVVLWTRLVPDPIGDPQSSALGPAALTVRWEVAEDDNFRIIAASGSASALPELAFSVHVDAIGLKPERWYWYRFMFGDAVSPVARTRTAPSPLSLPHALRFAFASCQHWEFGQYGAHRHIAAAAPDLVIFLGDYIYEWGPYTLSHPLRPQRSNESFTLRDYRVRYAQYKTDPHLQAAHHAAPWIVTWDDHEVANDYANDQDERLSADFLDRRAAAYQAFYEHMPVRLPPQPGPQSGRERFVSLLMMQRYDWGRLARFHVLDDRQYRSHEACPKPGRGGSNSVDATCSERLLRERTLLGAAQEHWLADGLARSSAGWNILAQQTLMAQASQVPIRQDTDGRFWTDGWDGYPAARARLFADLQRHRPANPVVISGDVHTFFAADLRADFQHPVSRGNPVLASEFCGTSVTSSSRPQARTDRMVADNAHIQYGRSDRRGFVMMEVTPARTTAQFQALDDVARADSAMQTVARFDVAAGKPGLQRTD